MNTIVDNFDQILDFAKDYGLPPERKKAIAREYLQTNILEILYREKLSIKVLFVGGTSLRLLRGLDRFSEDLDFDLLNISSQEVDQLVKKVHRSLEKENIKVDLYRNSTSKRTYYELRFQNLLYELKISENKDEKLSIKLDFERFWRGHNKEIVLLNRYGFLVNVVTVPLDQVLVQKLTAYLRRVQTQPRDLYDLIWLLSQRARLDTDFIKKNKLPNNLMNLAKEKFLKERKKVRGFKLKLRPFLLNPESAEKLELFAKLGY